VHTHAPYATTLACLGLEIPPVHYLLAALSEDGCGPLASYATYVTEELSGYASEGLGDVHLRDSDSNGRYRRPSMSGPRMPLSRDLMIWLSL
jgi:hypothetical protein